MPKKPKNAPAVNIPNESVSNRSEDTMSDLSLIAEVESLHLNQSLDWRTAAFNFEQIELKFNQIVNKINKIVDRINEINDVIKKDNSNDKTP